MSQLRFVEEKDLDFARFQCCGDEDLYPFGCPDCGRLMVFCYECDTLHSDLTDATRRDTPVNHFDPDRPIFPCPGCGFEFEYRFMENERYKVPLERWIEAGLREWLR